MQPGDKRLIRVQREWNGWRTAAVRLADLHDVHWRQPFGAPRQLVHGYVSCDKFVDGDVPHECEHTPPPHSILVCVLKSHTAPATFAELAQRADERLASQTSDVA